MKLFMKCRYYLNWKERYEIRECCYTRPNPPFHILRNPQVSRGASRGRNMRDRLPRGISRAPGIGHFGVSRFNRTKRTLPGLKNKRKCPIVGTGTVMGSWDRTKLKS